MPQNLGLDIRPRRPFWGPLAAILDFAGLGIKELLSTINENTGDVLVMHMGCFKFYSSKKVLFRSR